MDTADVISSSSVFGWEVYLATFAVWIIVYFIMWKGVNSSSYVVWVTVPLPILFIVVMIINNLTLDNASAGIDMYLKGYDAEGNPPDIGEKLKDGKMWAQACGQIFFSLGICMGTMTSYSSFNPETKPIIKDGFIIAFTNFFISFCAGFAVFSVVGYLIGIDSPVSDKTSSIGLAFVAYPAAIETMPVPNLWAFILGVTLFTLGIDSSFSMLEAAATVMQDSPMFRKWPRKLIALFLVVLGAICSIFFSFNWGFTFFVVVDQYLNVYLMLVIGILETFGAGWVYEAKQIFEKGRNYKLSLLILAVGYWVGVIVIPLASIFSDSSEGWIGLIAFWVWVLICGLVSFLVSGLKFGEWISNIAFFGTRKLARFMTKLSKYVGDDRRRWWEPLFEYWWGFCIKYFVPFALSFLIFNNLRVDTETPYEGYHIFWQVVGFMFPISGLLVFVLSIFIWTEKQEFEQDPPFDETDYKGTGAPMTAFGNLSKQEDQHLQRMESMSQSQKAKQQELQNLEVGKVAADPGASQTAN